MKRKILLITILLFIIILIFYCYKFFINGNNKTIKDVNDLEQYILNIKNYNLEAKITVNSNKNINTYILKETNNNNTNVQEIKNSETNEGIIVENNNSSITIKNTKLGLPRIFKDYENLFNNPIDLMTFVEDYKNDTKKEIKQKDNYYIVSLKTTSSNKYTTNKKMYFNKNDSKIEKIEIKDINNNNTIIIEYSSFKIL